MLSIKADFQKTRVGFVRTATGFFVVGRHQIGKGTTLRERRKEMKLIHCSHCGDVVRLLVGEVRRCKCGSSGGLYTDNLYATVWGPHCNPLALANEDMNPLSGAPYLANKTELIRSWWIKRGATDSYEVKYFADE